MYIEVKICGHTITCHLLLNKGHVDQQSGVVWIILILYLGLTCGKQSVGGCGGMFQPEILNITLLHIFYQHALLSGTLHFKQTQIKSIILHRSKKCHPNPRSQ